MLIYILGMAPEPGLAASWSVHCLLCFCPELHPFLVLAYCAFFCYCCVALEVLMTSIVASGCSKMLQNVSWMSDSLASCVPHATAPWRAAAIQSRRLTIGIHPQSCNWDVQSLLKLSFWQQPSRKHHRTAARMYATVTCSAIQGDHRL